MKQKTPQFLRIISENVLLFCLIFYYLFICAITEIYIL